MERNHKLLVVSANIHPAPTGSAVIVENIASTFAASEMVLLGDGKIEKPHSINGQAITHYTDPNISIRGKGQIYLRWANLNKLVRRITDLAQSEQCTAILAIFPDEFYMYAAYKVSKKLNLPFYTWFHNTYLDNREGIFKTLAKRLQPRFFAHAHTNFVMSDGMLNFFNEKYPEHYFRTLQHGFQIPNVTYTPYSPIRSKIRFMYSGSINESCLDATVRLFEVIRKHSNYELHIYGNESTVKYYNIDTTGFVMHGFVPWNEFVSAFKNYDIMLVPHGFDGERTEIEYKTIFPTRTIPLLYSNRPILAHSPKDVFLTDFLRENDCAEIVDEKDENAINAAIHRLLTDEKRREEVVRNAIRTSKIFDLKKVAQQLRTAINEEKE